MMGNTVTELKARYLVTAALPYANGRLHVGHVAGAYLPADIFVRFLRLTGREAHFICGSDENGAPITFSALRAGCSPQEIIDRYHDENERAFAGLNIDFSIFGRTHCPRHNEICQEFFLQLHEQGHVQKQTSQQVFCTDCQMFLPDRYVEGICHHQDCAAPGARGDQCEKCGRPIEATQLGDPECQICKRSAPESRGTVEVRETEHWYFRLDTFEKELRQYLDNHPEWRETVKRFSCGLLDQGLKERAITRDLPWGVPVPLAEGESKVLYVWFDAPIGYITFTRQYFERQTQPDKWKEFWQDDSTGLVHFIGKDNTVFHAVIFPSMLLAQGEYRLPDTVVANEFLNLEGDKISTSRNHAVWIDEYLEHFAPDPLRYYLTAIAPEASDSDFSWREFQAHNNGELADNLGNFIQRNLTFCAKYFDGEVPAAEIQSAAGKDMLAEIENARREIAARLAACQPKHALNRLMRFSQRGNQFLAKETPWQTRKTDMAVCAATIQVCLRAVEALSLFMAPFMPASSERLRAMLNLPPLAAGDWEVAWKLAPGHSLDRAEVLFPKIDDQKIEGCLQTLQYAGNKAFS